MKIEVIPSEVIPKKNREMTAKLPKELPPCGSMVLIQGSAGAGKSSILYSMMKNYQKSQRKGYFQVIIVFNRCADSDFVWKSFKTKHTEVKVFSHYDDEEMLEMFDNINELQLDRS